MRIFNVNDAEADINAFFGYEDKDNEGRLYLKWLKQVWLKHLVKNDPAWVFPIRVKGAPSFFVTDKASAPASYLEVDLPRFGRTRLEAQSDWDLKDAKAGTLWYYRATGQTLYQYVQILAPVRDYLRHEVFKGMDPETDIRKYSVPNMETAAARWHAEAIARIAREAAEREEYRRRNPERPRPIDTLNNDPVPGIDYKEIGGFITDHKEYVIVRLLTQQALNYETANMNHCIWSYGDQLHDKVTVLLSIRAKAAIHFPLISAELKMEPPMPGRVPSLRDIIQVQGPSNDNANLVIPRITANFPTFLRDIPLEHLAPLHSNSGDDLTFKVNLR